MIKIVIYLVITYIAYVMIKESKIFSILRGKSVRQKESYKNLDITDADYEDIKEEDK
tara:strand:- start:66 stop:236 length:171 start_codon:yes stop_codon:yes gene_type:complete